MKTYAPATAWLATCSPASLVIVSGVALHAHAARTNAVAAKHVQNAMTGIVPASGKATATSSGSGSGAFADLPQSLTTPRPD